MEGCAVHQLTRHPLGRGAQIRIASFRFTAIEDQAGIERKPPSTHRPKKSHVVVDTLHNRLANYFGKLVFVTSPDAYRLTTSEYRSPSALSAAARYSLKRRSKSIHMRSAVSS